MIRKLLASAVLFVAADAQAGVEVTFNSNAGSVAAATKLEVTVHSTDATPREIRPIHLEVPSEILLGSRPDAENRPSLHMQTSETGTKDLDAGGTIAQSVFLRPLTIRESLSPRALFFKSEDLPVYSIVEYTESMEHGPTQIRQKHAIRVTGPLVGIAFGGFIGVALAVLFTWAYAKSHGQSTPPWKQQVFIVLSGVLTVTIIALIRNADSALLKTVGVVVAIYDYRGGILVGLLFQPIAKKLSNWLLGKAADASASP
jgi:hypothetical protein